MIGQKLAIAVAKTITPIPCAAQRQLAQAVKKAADRPRHFTQIAGEVIDAEGSPSRTLDFT